MATTRTLVPSESVSLTVAPDLSSTFTVSVAPARTANMQRGEAGLTGDVGAALGQRRPPPRAVGGG